MERDVKIFSDELPHEQMVNPTTKTVRTNESHRNTKSNKLIWSTKYRYKLNKVQATTTQDTEESFKVPVYEVVFFVQPTYKTPHLGTELYERTAPKKVLSGHWSQPKFSKRGLFENPMEEKNQKIPKPKASYTSKRIDKRHWCDTTIHPNGRFESLHMVWSY